MAFDAPADLAPDADARAALLSAAQSDKPRVSVRTAHLRTILAAEQKAAADLHHAEGKIVRLAAEHDDLHLANHGQARQLAELKDLCRRGQQEITKAQAEAAGAASALALTTAPPLAVSFVELLGAVTLALIGGWLAHG